MFAILGASGKIGRATVNRLRAAGQPVRAILHKVDLAADFAAAGCEIAYADTDEPASLVAALAGATAVQVICPVALTASHVGDVMCARIDHLAAALARVKPAQVLAISDYGAELPSGSGITLVFHHMEAVLRQVPGALTLLRSCEHMQNWARVVGVAARDGILPSLHQPLDKLFPTVAAQDVGIAAAELLMEVPMANDQRISHIEGPRRYSALDVAACLAGILHRPVQAIEVPLERWLDVLTSAGLSASYADMVSEMFQTHNAGRIDAEIAAGPIRRGSTPLEDVLARLVTKLR
jgi:uncharacterized protein YbjT (DUF2867 family)